MRLAPWNRFKPFSKIFLLTLPRRYFVCGSFVFVCLLFLMLSRLFIAALWSPTGIGLTSQLLSVMFIVFLLLYHLVSWVRCGAWLYRYLIFAVFLTFTIILQYLILCFVVRSFMSILVLQSSWWGRESWLLCLIRLPGVSWWLSGSSSRCHRVVCGLWLWYFLFILTYYFWVN